MLGMGCLFMATYSFGQTQIYVSSNGDNNAPGSKKKPLKTIEEALKRSNKEASPSVEIILREGTHKITQTLVINKAVLGQNKKLTLRSEHNENAIVSSDYKIDNWEKISPEDNQFSHLQNANIWVADINELPQEKRFFKMMYDGDQMLRRARSKGFQPKTEKLPRFKCWEDLYTLYFPENTLRNWDNLNDIEVFVRPNQRYVVNYLPLAFVEPETGIAKTALPATYFMGPCLDHENPHISAWFENAPEALDEPGEWIVNSHTGKIYYWPENETPGNNIAIPLLREYIRVEGNISHAKEGDQPIQNIHIADISFTRGDRDTWTAQDKGLQHDWDMWDKDNAIIRLRGVENCSVTGCKFWNTAGNAIRLDRYARKNIVDNNVIHHIGGTGITLAGYGPGTKDVNRENQISNNDISYAALLYWHSSAIFLWQSGSNIVRNNKIGNLPYNGIAIAGIRPRFFDIWTNATDGMSGKIVPLDLRENMRLVRWNETGHPKTPEEVHNYNLATNNIIEKNEIFNCVELLKDGNSIYISAAGKGNILRQNLIYNCKQAQQEIRFDDDQEDCLASQNIIYGKGIRAKHSNYVENNYLFGGTVVIGKNTGKESRFNKNIIISPSNGRLYNGFYGGNEKTPDIHKKLLKSFQHDRNVFFGQNLKELQIQLDEQKASGLEQGSVVADPLFVDFDKFKLDLKPESEALKIGIEPIDYMSIGLEKDPAFKRFQKDSMPPYQRIKEFLYKIE